MESVSALLAAARAAGLVVAADGGRLVVRGERRHDALARRLLEEKRPLLARLAQEEREVGWRAAAMRGQVPRSGAIPLLVARERPPVAGRCVSCGEPLEPERPNRCALCVRAAQIVLGWVREGIGT